MQKNESKLTVFFDDPFWVGIYEKWAGGQLKVCKIIFGAEPKDSEVYEFLLKNWHRLQFSPPVRSNKKQKTIYNPKRMQRAIKRLLAPQGVGTKSQQALKLQQQAGKAARKEKSKQRREEKQQYKYQLRQQKHKEKHRGR